MMNRLLTERGAAISIAIGLFCVVPAQAGQQESSAGAGSCQESVPAC